jgi:Skp family chaperone for outer membrane proteins
MEDNNIKYDNTDVGTVALPEKKTQPQSVYFILNPEAKQFVSGYVKASKKYNSLPPKDRGFFVGRALAVCFKQVLRKKGDMSLDMKNIAKSVNEKLKKAKEDAERAEKLAKKARKKQKQEKQKKKKDKNKEGANEDF